MLELRLHDARIDRRERTAERSFLVDRSDVPSGAAPVTDALVRRILRRLEAIIELHNRRAAEIPEVGATRHGARVERRLPTIETGSTADHAVGVVRGGARLIALRLRRHRVLP